MTSSAEHFLDDETTQRSSDAGKGGEDKDASGETKSMKGSMRSTDSIRSSKDTVSRLHDRGRPKEAKRMLPRLAKFQVAPPPLWKRRGPQSGGDHSAGRAPPGRVKPSVGRAPSDGRGSSGDRGSLGSRGRHGSSGSRVSSEGRGSNGSRGLPVLKRQPFSATRQYST